MRLSDYQWSRNPRGLHNRNAYTPLDVSRYTRMRLGWAKIVCGGAEFTDQARALVTSGITPIVRIWRGHYGATMPDPGMYEVWRAYMSVGVKWFELYNEPNLDGEWPWPGGRGPAFEISYANTEQVIAPLMENWLTWAEWVVSMGCYPGLPALTETQDHRHASTRWAEAMVAYLAGAHRERFRYVIGNGMWIATHPYIANHFYQEVPGEPARARPPNQQTADQGGWRFEYPYDPLCQAHDPGRTVWGGTALTPNGDPNGLIAMGIAFNELLARYVNAGPVPVVGTEGGIWRIPEPDDPPHVIDDRYPGYTWRSHPEATLAMFEWMGREAPPWMFGLTLWKEEDYYEHHVYGEALAVNRLAGRAPVLKDVPPIETISGDVPPTPAVVGPAPVHGLPDYHFLVLAPGLQADWFFAAARRYWQTFRPVVLTHLDLIRYVPNTHTVAVTVLARSDTIGYMDQEIRDAWPNVWYDPVVADTLEGMTQVLEWRAERQTPFGTAPMRTGAPGEP